MFLSLTLETRVSCGVTLAAPDIEIIDALLAVIVVVRIAPLVAKARLEQFLTIVRVSGSLELWASRKSLRSTLVPLSL